MNIKEYMGPSDTDKQGKKTLFIHFYIMVRSESQRGVMKSNMNEETQIPQLWLNSDLPVKYHKPIHTTNLVNNFGVPYARRVTPK